MGRRIYILSPANTAGKRAGYLLADRASFDLARKLRTPWGAELGEVFTFMSGLYFRGKLAYARRFADPPAGVAGVQVVVPGRGLLPADTPVTLDDLRAMAEIGVDLGDPRYLQPLQRAVHRLAGRLSGDDAVVLLGSIATDKYVTALRDGLGARLRFPREFVGRGDMSRGGLLLRRAASGETLDDVPLGAVPRRGTRPPRLEPARRVRDKG